MTTLLITAVARGLWRWRWLVVGPIMGLLLLLDITFVSANVHKIPAGGWFPLLVGAVALTVMLCWRRGRVVAFAKRDEKAISLDGFIANLEQSETPLRKAGCAIYFTKQLQHVPAALLLNLKHNGVVHERVVLLTVTTNRVPRVSETERVTVKALASGFRQVELRFGFAEKPDIPAAIDTHRDKIGCGSVNSSYFLGREDPVPSLHPGLPRWQERIYAFMTRNAVRAPDYFLIPPEQVVELGTKVEM